LNGAPVEEQARVANYAQIRAGSTQFIFIAIQPAATAPVPTPAEGQNEK
jgi:hypothetical protein